MSTTLEMAHALYHNPQISMESSFFGLRKKIIYAKTNSIVEGKCFEFNPAEGEKIQRLMEANANDFGAMLRQEGVPETCENGNYRLSLCFSKDHQFAAFLLQRFVDFEYRNLGEARFIEGDSAEVYLHPFLK